MPYFDVIIPTYNNKGQLGTCLNSLRFQEFTDFKVIVCIDGSTDGTREMVEGMKLGYQCCIVEHADGKNRGRNAARNLALPVLDSQACVTLDSDLMPNGSTLVKHYEVLKKRDVMSVGKVLHANWGENPWAAYLNTRGSRRYEAYEEIPWKYFNTGNAAFPTYVFLELGGQDAQMKNYGGGDVEFALRAYKRFGLPTIWNKYSHTIAFHEKSIDQALDQLEEMGRTNLRYIRQKHPDVTEIFGLHYLTAPDFSSTLVRAALRLNVAFHRMQGFKLLPIPFRNKLIEYQVLARIHKGFFADGYSDVMAS